MSKSNEELKSKINQHKAVEYEKYYGLDELHEAAEHENAQRILEYWEGEEAEERSEFARQKCLLVDEVEDCLRRYIELGGSLIEICLIKSYFLDIVFRVLIQLNKPNQN